MSNLVSDVMIELHVPDFELAKEFYSYLGFRVIWEKKPEKKKGYLVMKAGDNSILSFYCGNEQVYKHSYFKKFPKETKRGYAVEIIIPCDDIKNLYKKIQLKHNNLIVEPLIKRFDKLDFRMVDPFGFYLRFVERYDWVNGRDVSGNLIKK